MKHRLTSTIVIQCFNNRFYILHALFVGHHNGVWCLDNNQSFNSDSRYQFVLAEQEVVFRVMRNDIATRNIARLILV